MDTCSFNIQNNQNGSELLKINKSDTLIVCFGGMALSCWKIPPFEFLKFLSNTYGEKYDYIFYVDKNQCWYHKGFKDITNNIESSVEYLKKKMVGYKKVIFMGTSAGGYASILFGSLCNVSTVVAFIPQTLLNKPIDKKYEDLKSFINDNTRYFVYGDNNGIGDHDIKHCENINCFQNVILYKMNGFDIKQLRDNGQLKIIIDIALN